MHDVYRVKSRFKLFPDKNQNETFPKIMNEINNSLCKPSMKCCKGGIIDGGFKIC